MKAETVKAKLPKALLSHYEFTGDLKFAIWFRQDGRVIDVRFKYPTSYTYSHIWVYANKTWKLVAFERKS
jgi:hypothetical protein